MTRLVHDPVETVGAATVSLASTFTGTAFEAQTWYAFEPVRLSTGFFAEIDVDPGTVTFTFLVEATEESGVSLWATAASVTQASAWAASGSSWVLAGNVGVFPWYRIRITVAAASGNLSVWLYS